MIKNIKVVSTNGEPWDINLCTERHEVLEILQKHGDDVNEINRFTYLFSKDKTNVAVALCKSICSDVFEQVYGYCRAVGLDIHFSELLQIIKSFDE